MSLKIDRMQLEVVINNDQARKSLRQLDDEAKRLKKELRKVPEGSDEYKKITARLKEITVQHDKIIQSLGVEKLTIAELTRRQKELNAVMKNLDPSTQAYRDLEKQLIAIKNRQAQLRQQTNQTNVSLSKLAEGFNKYLAIVTAGVATFSGAIMAGRKAIQVYAEFDDKVADVMKTTGLTRDQVYAMNEEFKKIDTRTAQEDLLGLAWAAGKLGITAQEDVMGFVRAADKINVALSKDLGSSEEAIRQIGKLVDVFKVRDNYGIEEGMLKVASAINELGMASTANEAFIVEFAKRAAGIAPLAGVSIANVLGLAATLDALGQQAESSSTVYTMVMTKMTSNTEAFARIAGKSVDDFSTLLRTDANEAFLQLLEGLNGNAEGMEALVQNLGDVQLEGRRSTAVLGVLANNTEMLRTQQQLSNEAYIDGNSVINEFNIKNETAQAVLEKKRKILRNLTVELGQKLMPILTVSTSAFSYFVRAMINGPRILREYKTEITLLIGALLMVYSTQLRLIAATALQNLTLQGGIALRTKELILTRAANIAETFRLALIGKTTLATKAAAVATTSWSIALKAVGGPIGVMIAVLTANIALMQKYSKGAREARELEVEKNKALDDSKKLYEALSERTEKYRNIQEQLNLMSVERKNNLKEEIQAELDLAEATLVSVRTRQLAVEEDNARITLWRVMLTSLKLMFKGEQEAIEGIEKLQEAAKENGRKSAEEFNIHIQNIITRIDELRNRFREVVSNLEAERLGDEILGETISQLQQKLSFYRTALNNTAIGSADYQRISAKLSATQKDLNDAMSAGNQLMTDAENAYDALTKKIAEAQSALRGFVAENNYSAARATNAVIKNLEAQKLVLDGIISAGGDVESFLSGLTDSTQAELEETLAFNQRFADDFKVIFEELNAEKELRHQEELDRINRRINYELDQERKLKEAQEQLERDWAQAKIDIAFSAINSAFDIFRNNLNYQTSEQLAALNRERDADINNKRLTVKQRERIEEDYRKREAKIKEESFKKQRAADVVGSIINTALAVSRAMSVAPGWPLNLPSVLAAGIAGAAQTAVIAAQKAPTYAKGNYQQILGDDGKMYRARVTDKKHRSGLYNEPTYVPGFGIFGETRDPELVFNPRDTQVIMNSPALITAIRHTLGSAQTFSQGNAREIIKEINSSNTTHTDPEIKQLLIALSQRLETPPVAYLIGNEDYIRKHMEIETEYNKFTKAP